ncbi:MAG TPA: DegT/DnrJ/EryC1/StrS family aminotransferase [Sedimentisphaerales bacterium]|nr:DegT/DnrJ/EryC1/StrS family aminotransferase [Sedimentisphaerales bacterium]HRS11763.1 DegT/DnrJ/EryC1/StrS family aminotransferase [Sedimentisphaerales bacterium]HRV48424.1 DegT/DnrJ/EryC1/StrS family aminotransferase [Sedimentisphaerales bacterium]
MSIPVQRPYLGPEELAAVQRVFESRWLGMGSVCRAFEEQLQQFLGVRHVVAVNSGTAALHLALTVLGLQSGDEVIVPTLTFVATAQAVRMTGATPVFCDVDEWTFNLDVRDAAVRITSRTKAIIPVHYGGTACDIEAVQQLAADAHLHVVEDAAHAFGSTCAGRRVGTLSRLTCFSFDPVKNITCGEGGAIATNDSELARNVARLRVLGIDSDTWSRRDRERPWFYDVTGPGFRYHLSDINAAIGLEQLKRFDFFLQRRQEIARRYDEAFGGLGGLTLRRQHLERTCPFFYVVRVRDGRRDRLMHHLKDRGIASGIHYIPNHLHRLFIESRTSLPVAERLYSEMLTLPLFCEMSNEQVDTVIAAVRGFFDAAPHPIVSLAGPFRSAVAEPSPTLETSRDGREHR